MTKTVRFTEFWEGDPLLRSPGPDHPKHSQPPEDGILYAHLHLHVIGTKQYPNEDFSRGINEDQDIMAKSRLSNFYVVTPTGRVLHNNPGGNSFNRGEDGEFGYWETYSNYGSKSKKVIIGTRWVSLNQPKYGGPLYSSMDAAAVGWAINGGDKNTRTNFVEYASVIFSTVKNGIKYYGYTPHESFEGVKGKDPTINSPGPGDNLNLRHLPFGATLVAYIHSHTNKGSNPNNFSKRTFAQFGDEGLMGIFPDVEFYLVTPDGKLFSASQSNQFPKVKGFPNNPKPQWDQLSTRDLNQVGIWWYGNSGTTVWPK